LCRVKTADFIKLPLSFLSFLNSTI